MPGRRQKPPELLANQRGGRARTLQVVDDGDRRVPPLPRHARHIGPVARQAWRDLWRSAIRAAVDTLADSDVLLEYVLLIDERERIRAEMLERGRTPADASRMAQVERQIQRIREHLGLTPLARFRLQLQVLSGREREQRLAAQAEQPEPPAVVVLDEPAPEPWRPGGSQAAADDGGDGDSDSADSEAAPSGGAGA